MLLAGCQKPGGAGRAIRFSAVTTAPGQTKTAYSGVVTGGYERIDWSSNDQIKLMMKNAESSDAFALYKVSQITPNGKQSGTKLEAVDSENTLEWGTGTHDFWAAYPAVATFGDHTIKGEIPASQVLTYRTKTNNTLFYDPSMSTALMVAGDQATPSSSTEINLSFEPAFTIFDFTVGANSDVVITGFTMETITSAEASKNILSGDATATFDSSMACEYSATGSTGQSISTTFSPAAALSTTTSLNFKLFAVPCDIKGVTIAFTISSPVSRTLSLKLKYSDLAGGDWVEFHARDKCNISGLLVPGAEWTITMDGPRVEQWTIVPEVVFGVE